MKTLAELRISNLNIKAKNPIVLCRIKDLENKKIDFDVFLPSRGCNLQREYVWNIEQQRELIMSILLERYIPNACIISLLDRNDVKSLIDIWQVIDGKQRILTMLKFYKNEFSILLDGKEYFYKDLSKEYQLEISHYHIIARVVYDNYDKDIPDDDKITWFKLINFAGTSQDKEHLEKFK